MAGPLSDSAYVPAIWVASKPPTEPATLLPPASRVQSDSTARPPLSLVRSLTRYSDGASSSLTKVHVTVSPRPMVTSPGIPPSPLSQVTKVLV